MRFENSKKNKHINKNYKYKKKSFALLFVMLLLCISVLGGCGLAGDKPNPDEIAAEEQAKKEAEEQAKKEAEEKAKKEAEEKAKKEAEEKAKKEAEEQAKKEAEEKAKKEAEEQAKKEAEEQAKKEAEEQAKKEAEGQIGDAAFYEVWKYDNCEAIEEVWDDFTYWYSEPNSYIKTLAMFEDAKKIISNSTLNFKNKKIYCLGDSITYGSGSSEITYNKRKSYVYFLEEIFGCTIENVSYPGATIGSYLIGNNITNQADSVKSDADIIIVFGGVNDYISYNYSYGEDFETRGYYKADTKYLMEKLRLRAPDADIFFVTTYRNREQEDPNIPVNIPFDNYMSVQKELAGGYNVHMIDIYKQGFLDNHDDQSYHEFFYDLIHPNDDGSRVLGKYIAGQIISYYYKAYIDSQNY